mgnify:CR=1 FL=1
MTTVSSPGAVATERRAREDTEIKNLTLWFDNGVLSRMEGEYFPEQDQQLAKSARKQFGPNLAKDKK